MSPELAPPPLGKALVSASALRLRDEPKVTSPALSTVPRGTEVDVLVVAASGLWAQVRAGRRVGWMSCKYLVSVDHPLAPVTPYEEFPWMPIAGAELGVAEALGPASNPRVVEYLESTTLERGLARNDETPWCSGFVNWCVERAGIAGTDSAAALSWLHWGRPLSLPRRGCIAVFSRGKLGGHVAFFVSRSTTTVQVLGGNQSNRVCVAGYDATRLLGYRVAS